LSLLSPEEADRKLKSILIALLLDAYKMHDAHESIEGYDEIAQRFGDDQDPEVQKQVGRALLHKGKALNHQADKLEEAIAIYDDVAQRFGNDMDVTSALANAAEAALILGRNEEAVQRAKALQAHADADKGDKIIMAFIIWLADPKTPLQHVQKAIQAAGDRTEFHWSFTEVKPFIDNLPKTRKKQAGCFIDYFTQYASKKELQACLKK
jgi:tetratricopeptide (TPR) repeat protein